MFLFFPFRFFGWSNMKLANTDWGKKKANLILDTGKLHKNMRPLVVRQLRLIGHPELRRQIRTWGFKGMEGNSQDNKKSGCYN